MCQNLNTNLLVNISAYKSVLDKLMNSEKDQSKKDALNTNIETLNVLESSVSGLLNTVQQNLNIPVENQINPQKVIEESSKTNTGSGNFMTKLLGAEAAAILGSMTAAAVIMLGGAKYKRRKFTKRKRVNNNNNKKNNNNNNKKNNSTKGRKIK